MNHDPQADVETRLILALNQFLEQNHLSELVDRGDGWAIVSTPGITTDQVWMHLILCVATLGAWLPVFGIIAILRTPKTYLIDATDPGGVWTSELSCRD